MLLIIQITDTHLLPEKHQLLRGHDTDRSLCSILDHVTRQAAPLDLILVTGDLAHQGDPCAYARIKFYLERMGVRIECLPGNHDNHDVMRASLVPCGIGFANIIDRKRWRIIMLDSVVQGSDHGQLSHCELVRLDRALKGLSEGHALVCLHHPPVAVGNPSMDKTGLSNAKEFFRVIDAYSSVRAILWGHAHSDFGDIRRGVKLLGTRSTCFQFRASDSGITVDDSPPAYRWLWLFPDGTVHTGVTSVSAVAIE